MNEEFVIYKDMSGVDSACLFFVKELDTKFFPNPWTAAMWQQSLNQDHFIIVLKSNNQVIGFALFNVNLVDSFAHLYKIVLDPAYRSMQLGTGLLKRAIDELMSMGVREYFLEVEEFNHSAQAIYKKVGFVVLHLKKQFYSDGKNALIMKMSL